MKLEMSKIAAGIAKQLKIMAKEDRVHIDNDVWKKSKKKAEIVDLWHQVAKVGFHDRGQYNRSFPFSDAEKFGIEFWCYSNENPGMGRIVKKRLDKLGVKYDTDDN